MRKTTVLALLIALALPHVALALPREAPPGGGRHGQHQDDPQPRPAEQGRGTFGWFLQHLEPLLALVLPQTPGPDADPNGVVEPPPPEVEGDAGPDADPNG